MEGGRSAKMQGARLLIYSSIDGVHISVEKAQFV